MLNVYLTDYNLVWFVLGNLASNGTVFSSMADMFPDVFQKPEKAKHRKK